MNFVIEGISTILDIIEAPDQERAEMLFRVKYPAVKSSTIKTQTLESFDRKQLDKIYSNPKNQPYMAALKRKQVRK
jgi:uncharacterized protein with GYD domain